EVEEVAEGSLARLGERLLVAAPLAGAVAAVAGITRYATVAELDGADLPGTLTAHPLRGQGYDFDAPLLAGDFSSAEDGPGLVHTAPGPGADDFELGRRYGIEAPQTVGPDGTYYAHVPLFAGRHVYWPNGKTGDANKAVIDALAASGGLLAQGTLVHSYPHSRRSKPPL